MYHLIFCLYFLAHQAFLCWTDSVVDFEGLYWRHSYWPMWDKTSSNSSHAMLSAQGVSTLWRAAALRLRLWQSRRGQKAPSQGELSLTTLIWYFVINLRKPLAKNTVTFPKGNKKKVTWGEFLSICPFQISSHTYPCPGSSNRLWFNDFAKLQLGKSGLGSIIYPTKRRSLNYSRFPSLYIKIS